MTKRIFVAIDMPEDVQNKVIEVQKMLPEFKGKLTEKQNLHLTLKFLGEQHDELITKIQNQLTKIDFESFDAKIETIGVFSKDFIRIVWLHVKNCDELQNKVDETLRPYFNIEQRFMSHLTIARVKKIKDKNYFLKNLDKIEFPAINFTVNSFKLKESVLTPEGPVYKTIAEYKSKKI